MNEAEIRNLVKTLLAPEVQRMNHALLRIDERLRALDTRPVSPTMAGIISTQEAVQAAMQTANNAEKPQSGNEVDRATRSALNRINDTRAEHCLKPFYTNEDFKNVREAIKEDITDLLNDYWNE